MSDYNGILMAYNGSHITDIYGNTLAETRIETETARSILAKMKEMPVTVILDDGKQIYAEDINGFKVMFECKVNDMKCEIHRDLAEFVNFAPFKILLEVDPSKILEVQKVIASQLPENLAVVRTNTYYLEIIPKSMDKGKGLLQICSAAGIAPENTVAFGDSECDIPLLKAAGLGIAMGNAEEGVKEIADRITLSNNENGIVYALEEIPSEIY